MELPSNQKLGDDVDFYPDIPFDKKFKDMHEEHVSPLRGEIIGVKFTKSKVYYDIVDKDYQSLFENVDSALVSDYMEWKENN